MFEWGEFSEKGLHSIANSNARINIWEGSVRSSKTTCSLVRWITFVSQAPQGDLLMAGKTERTLKRNILNPLKDMLGKQFRFVEGKGEASMFGRRIMVVGASDERAESKIRGGTFAGTYLDEWTLFPESFTVMLLSRMSVPGAKLFATTNPDNPYHYIKKNYIDNPEIDKAVFHFELDDNPNLGEEFKDAIKKEYSGLWYKRFIQGLWVMAEGAIYDMFREDVHMVEVSKDYDDYIKIWAAVDYGTSNPCTFGIYGKHKDGKRYKLAEWYFDSSEAGYQKTDAQYADDFSEFVEGVPIKDVYVDPSAASFKTELERRGFPVVDANNDVLDGIRIVSTELEQGRYFIDKSCKHTAKEFVSYAWDPKAQKRGEDKPIKQNDHAMDCDRYALASELLIPDFYIK